MSGQRDGFATYSFGLAFSTRATGRPFSNSTPTAKSASEQQKLLDEGADPDDDELGDVEVYSIEDLLKWAIANGYFDYPPEERAARNE
jgi:hypothetical protein